MKILWNIKFQASLFIFDHLGQNVIKVFNIFKKMSKIWYENKKLPKSLFKVISLQQNMGAFHGSISLNCYFSKNDEIVFHMTTMTHADKLSHYTWCTSHYMQPMKKCFILNNLYYYFTLCYYWLFYCKLLLVILNYFTLGYSTLNYYMEFFNMLFNLKSLYYILNYYTFK
jgi:hypothetical protein